MLSWGDLICFKDSYQFLSCSLEQLAENLKKSGKENFINLLEEFQEQPSDLILRKGVYPYDYMDSMDRFNETNLPTQTSFNNKLKDTECTDADYQHAHNVWKSFHCKTFQDYHDLYLKSMHFFFLSLRQYNICFIYYGNQVSFVLCSGCPIARRYL